MAKYQVKMSCGHIETIELFGKGAERERKIEWLKEHGICSVCYKAQLAADRAAKTAAAADKAAQENLPELTGSEKQINWALSIRAKILADLDKMIDDQNAKVTDAQIKSANETFRQATRNILVANTDSRFWIDNRNTPARRLIASAELRDAIKAEYDKLAEAQKVVEVNDEIPAATVETQKVANDKAKNDALQSDSQVCAICGEPIEGAITLAHALDGSLIPVCATCVEYDVTTIPRHGEKLIKCDSCGELFVADPYAPDPDVGRKVLDEETLQWVSGAEPFDDAQGAWRPDINAWICNKCLEHHHVRCSKCKAWTHVDDCVHNDDGQVICRNCDE